MEVSFQRTIQRMVFILNHFYFSQETKEFRRRLHLYLVVFAAAVRRSYKMQLIRFEAKIVDLSESLKACDSENDCAKGRKETATQDNNRLVFMPKTIMELFLLVNFQWIAVSLSTANRRRTTDSQFFVQVHELLPINNANAQEVSGTNYVMQMSPVTATNMRRTLSYPEITSRKLALHLSHIVGKQSCRDLNVFSTSSNLFSVRFRRAKVVRIAQLKSSTQVESFPDVDELFKRYFQDDKLMEVDDVFTILDVWKHRRIIRGRASLTFKITEIESENSHHHDNIALHVVNSSYTSLYLLAKQENDFQPSSPCALSSINPFLQVPTHKIIQVLQEGVDASRVLSSSNTSSQFWPHILLYTSSPAYDQIIEICKCIAISLGLNLCDINAVNYLGDSTAYTEAKLNALVHQVRRHTPCLAVIRNIHVIGNDKEGYDDKRATTAFREALAQLHCMEPRSRLCNFVVGVSNAASKITKSLSQSFLHVIKINIGEQFKTSYTIQEDFISWIQEEYNFVLEDPKDDMLDWIHGACNVLREMYDLMKVFDFAARKAYHAQSNQPNQSQKSQHLEKLLLTRKQLEEALNVVSQLSGRSESNSFAVKIPDVHWEDIGGLSEIKEELFDSIQLPLRFPDIFKNGPMRSGTLLYGPPGTGKTLVAKAVATDFRLNFLSIKGPELLNMYVGQSEQNIRDVFDMASRAAPCVVFFDELDSLAPSRGRSGDSGGVMDRVVSQLLAEMDGSSPHVFVLAATNRPDLIDPALLRPGRFDKLLYVGVPNDLESKVNILTAITRKFKFGSDVDLAVIASKLPTGMTGADLSSFCTDAFMVAASKRIARLEEMTESHGIESLEEENGSVIVSQDDFEAALEHVSISLSESDSSHYEQLQSLKRSAFSFSILVIRRFNSVIAIVGVVLTGKHRVELNLLPRYQYWSG